MTHTDGTTPRYRIERTTVPTGLNSGGTFVQYVAWYVAADGTETRGPRRGSIATLRGLMTRHYGAVEVQS